jgi:hypothetical protein
MIGKWFTDQFLALMSGGREDKLEDDGMWLLNYINRAGVVYRPGQPKSMAVRDIARNRSMKSEDVRKIVSTNLGDLE